MGIRGAFVALFRRIVRIYFREVEVVGDVPAASTAGRLFAANHVNGLVDPILVLTQTPCVVSPVAKSTLWSIPGLRFLLDVAEAVPIVRRRDAPGKSESDNDAVFERVAKHLGTGGNILIFPEGTSHNEPHLLALRSGAGRMLARAASPGLTFQTVALEFDDREVFRSRALVVFGPVRRVEDVGADAAAITARIQEDLSELLVEGATWEERRLIVRLAEMLSHASSPLEELNALGRRIEAARRVLASAAPDDVARFEARLRAYTATLDEEETTDDEVVAREPAPGNPTRAAVALATLPLAVFAVVAYGLPYQLPRFVTRRLKGDPDVSSTYKLGVGLIVYPAWAALLLLATWLLLPTGAALAATALVLLSPFAALAWLDRWDRVASRARRVAPSEDRRERLAHLAAERTAILAELERLRLRAEA